MKSIDEQIEVASSQSSLITLAEPKTIHRRVLANMRERRRMVLINRGFEILRDRLPLNELLGRSGMSFCVSNDNIYGDRRRGTKRERKCRLTKVDILKLSIHYIGHLSELLRESNEGESNINRISKLESSKISKSRHKRSGQTVVGGLKRIKPSKVNAKNESRVVRSIEEVNDIGLQEKEVTIQGKVMKFDDKEESRMVVKNYRLSWFKSKSESELDHLPSKLWIPECG